MTKILISWVAINNDFTSGKMPLRPDGPNATVHKKFWEYDYHLLLSEKKTPDDDIMLLHLANHLRASYNHQVEVQAMGIDDVINVSEILGKVSALLYSHQENEIDIFLSPGTPAMQVAWYLAHETLHLKTRLFQIRKPEHTKEDSQQVWVEVRQSKIPTALLIREELKSQQTNTNFLITESVRPVYDTAQKVAATDKVTVLIMGETGTGKEGLARYIHAQSPRSKGPFMAINCAAMGESLLESRLFGYAEGAFTGAGKGAAGYFEAAEGGTIFLDEIGDITPYMQQSLLRVIQEKEITRIGETKARKINVRIIAATNRDLVELCNEKKFRWDLYYRLSVVDLTLPSLKSRGAKEIEEIFNFILQKKLSDFKRKLPAIPKDIRKQIFNYTFPGNIREMENLIERIYATTEDEITADSLPQQIISPVIGDSLKLEHAVTLHVKKVYDLCNKNVSKTAKLLGVFPNTVRAKLNLKERGQGIN